MEKFNRAVRRHHAKRLKKNRQRYWSWDKDLMTPRLLGIVLHTPKVCSCGMCGNPRKWSQQRSIQELAMFQDKLHE
jgi:hypothetical protein